MKISDQQIDKIFTIACLAIGFLLIIFAASKSIEFQKRCETKCYPKSTITPFIDGSEKCFCDEGAGKWRLEEIGTN